jgi:hypothetical protein
VVSAEDPYGIISVFLTVIWGYANKERLSTIGLEHETAYLIQRLRMSGALTPFPQSLHEAEMRPRDNYFYVYRSTSKSEIIIRLMAYNSQ